MRENSLPIFVSVGRHYRSEETVLIERISTTLRAFGATPLTLPPERWDARTPLQAISRLMSQCAGVLVIAFPRVRCVHGYEWPDSPEQQLIATREVATVWLHVEATLAFAIGLPTLVLTERRLHPEGLLNPKHQEYRAIEYDTLQRQDGLPDSLTEALRAFVVELAEQQT